MERVTFQPRKLTLYIIVYISYRGLKVKGGKNCLPFIRTAEEEVNFQS